MRVMIIHWHALIESALQATLTKMGNASLSDIPMVRRRFRAFRPRCAEVCGALSQRGERKAVPGEPFEYHHRALFGV